MWRGLVARGSQRLGVRRPGLLACPGLLFWVTLIKELLPSGLHQRVWGRDIQQTGSMHLELEMGQGSAQYDPEVKSSPSCVLLNEVLWEYSDTHAFSGSPWLLLHDRSRYWG